MKFLKRWSLSRLPWFILFIGGIAAIAFAHLVGEGYYKSLPCYYCILDRYYMMWMSIAGIIGMIAPRILILRIIAILVFLYATISGVIVGIENIHHINLVQDAIASNKLFLPTCPSQINELIPIQKWLPNLFTPLSNCENGGPVLLGIINLVQATLLVFCILAIIAILVLISQFRRLTPAATTANSASK